MNAMPIQKIVSSAILSLGSNIGARADNLRTAIIELGNIGVIQGQSSVYETSPWGNEEQAFFLNQAVELCTELCSIELLDKILAIESSMGRVRDKKWESRIIDIDIVFFGDQVIESDRLTVPHPFMHERAFVLIPLLEICPNRVHPTLQKTVWQLFDECRDLSEVYLPDVPL